MRVNPSHRIVIEPVPAQSDLDFVGQQLAAFNESKAGDARYRRLALFVRNEADQIVGGLVGSMYWGWLAVDLLWVHAALRGQGYGHRLLEMAEQEAIAHGCQNAHLDTFSFQALDFYQKRGYKIFGQIDGLPPGSARYYLKKKLI